jgi:uncharacterized protein YecT (DUF1311 family)
MTMRKIDGRPSLYGFPMSTLSHVDAGQRKPPSRLWYLAAVLVAFFAADDLAQAEQANACADAANTVEIRECLDKAYTKADAELNDVWKQVMAQVSAADYLPAKERKSWQDELLESQRAWIKFKEHDCDAVGFEWYGGSGAGGAILNCLLEHTQARTADLKERYLDR